MAPVAERCRPIPRLEDEGLQSAAEEVCGGRESTGPAPTTATGSASSSGWICDMRGSLRSSEPSIDPDRCEECIEGID